MQQAIETVRKLESLLETASTNGGLWVSAGGGTKNVIAGEISRHHGLEYGVAHTLLTQMLGEDWYSDLYWAQPRVEDWDELRFDARTIVRAAIRNS